MESTGPPRDGLISSFNIFKDNDTAIGDQRSFKRNMNNMPVPLTTSKLVNQLPSSTTNKSEETAGDRPLESWTEQQNQSMLSHPQHVHGHRLSLAVDSIPDMSSPDDSMGGRSHAAEVIRLRRELELAKERMAQMDLQLTSARQVTSDHSEPDLLDHSRMVQLTVEQAIGSPLPAARRPSSNLGDSGHGGTALCPVTANSCGNRALAESTATLPHPRADFGRYHSGQMPPLTSFGFTPTINSANNHSQQFRAPIEAGRPFLSSAASDLHQPRVPFPQHQTAFMNTAQPINYRHLLNHSTSCNWKYIVDKIVENNDQQASIFLQQKLKAAMADHKFEIVQAIIDQAYPLMVNRFGNFLVQRCFEHGTPKQVVAIAQAIRGNMLSLSMDSFGCHVVQKAFDCVPEDYKAIMVHELLRHIPETIIHRYACHVWQKLFELRWSDTPPHIMEYVNEALRGMWHEVALGETGSLVVQNIFENCLEEDKRPCINEVLSSIDVIAHGQFGNWCIQHVCEHGSTSDRTRAMDHVLRFAVEYSTDQFASKVVEKCLKLGSEDFVDRYIDRVCEAHPDHPRMPLIDIAGDQFGNYLIQYILTQADPEHREIVATGIRKHMVSLRGSKHGSRVAMLCCNPTFASRPGPLVGPPTGRSSFRYAGHLGFDSGLSFPAVPQHGGRSRDTYSGYR